MTILHICAENDNHKPYEVIVCDPDPENLPEDYIPEGFHITEKNMINLEGVDWPYFPSGSTFANTAYLC